MKSNVNKVLRQMDQLGSGLLSEESRQALEDVAGKYVPAFKSVTPKKTGEAAGSVTVKSSSTGSSANATLTWQAPHAGFVNSKGNKKGFASKKFRSLKQEIDHQAKEALRESDRKVIKGIGIKVK